MLQREPATSVTLKTTWREYDFTSFMTLIFYGLMFTHRNAPRRMKRDPVLARTGVKLCAAFGETTLECPTIFNANFIVSVR